MSPNTPFSVRLTPQLRARIEAHRSVLAAQLGYRVSLSDTIVSLIASALPPAREAK